MEPYKKFFQIRHGQYDNVIFLDTLFPGSYKQLLGLAFGDKRILSTSPDQQVSLHQIYHSTLYRICKARGESNNTKREVQSFQTSQKERLFSLLKQVSALVRVISH